MKKAILWTIIKLTINLVAITFIVISVYQLTQSFEWAGIAFAAYAGLFTLIVTNELEIKPSLNKSIDTVEKLSDTVTDNQVVLISGYKDFIRYATDLVSTTRGRLFVMRVHTTGVVKGDDEYFAVTRKNLSNGKINLYRRLVLTSNKSSRERIKNTIKKLGSFEQVEIKTWTEPIFPTLVELILSDNAGILVFKSDEGPPKTGILVQDGQLLESLFNYFNEFWMNDKSQIIIERGKISRDSIKEIIERLENKKITPDRK